MGYLILLLFICVSIFYIYNRMHISKKNFDELIKQNYEKKTYDFLYFSKSVPYLHKRKFLDFIENINELEELFYEEELRIIVDDKPLSNILRELKLNRLAKKNIQGVYIPYLKTIILSTFSLSMETADETSLLSSDREDIKVFTLYEGRALISLSHEIGHFLESVSDVKLANTSEFKQAFKNEKSIIFPNKEDKYYKNDIGEYLAQTIAYYLVLRDKFEYHENIFVNESYDTYSLINKYIKVKERAI